MEKTIFTIGAGRGLGNAVARKFASNGFHAVLMSRSAGHLDEYRREFAAEGFQIDTLTADAAAEKYGVKRRGDNLVEFAYALNDAIKSEKLRNLNIFAGV